MSIATPHELFLWLPAIQKHAHTREARTVPFWNKSEIIGLASAYPPLCNAGMLACAREAQNGPKRRRNSLVYCLPKVYTLKMEKLSVAIWHLWRRTILVSFLFTIWLSAWNAIMGRRIGTPITKTWRAIATIWFILAAWALWSFLLAVSISRTGW